MNFKMIKSRDEILKDIKSLSDEQYKKFHSGLCPGNKNILGVRVPKLREYAKELISEDWKETYKNIENEYYEEIMLQGMILGLVKEPIEEICKYLEEFVTRIDNWAVCDITCSGLKCVNKNKEVMWKFLDKYLKSDKEFELRFAIIMLLDYYIEDEYVDKVISILDNMKHTEYYYVKMGIAWTISVIYVKYPEKAMKYLQNKNNQLDKETYNKSLQKIIESNRVGKREKNQIRRMKK